MPRKSARSIRFKTHKSVLTLIHAFTLHKDFPRRCQEMNVVSRAYFKLWRETADEAKEWARTYRKSHGKPAILDDFFAEHAEHTAELLQALEAAVDALDRDWYNDERRQLIDTARVALANLWALTMEPDEITAKRVAEALSAFMPQPQPTVEETAEEEPPKKNSFEEFLKLPPEEQRRRNDRLTAALGLIMILLEEHPIKPKAPEEPELPPLKPEDSASLADDIDAWLKGE
jgi:hypothetical protein